MNKLELLQFGEMIEKTAERHSLVKHAQVPLHALIGALGGGAAGYKAYDAIKRNEGTASGRLLSSLAGAGLGSMAFGGAGSNAARFNAGRLMHGIGTATQQASPWIGAGLGGLAGYNTQYLMGRAFGDRGKEMMGAPDDPNTGWSNSTRLLAAALGAGAGASGFSALNQALRNRGLSSMRQAFLDEHGGRVSEDIMNTLRNSSHAGAVDIARNDPNRLVASQLATKGVGRIEADDLASAWGNADASRELLHTRAMPAYTNAAGRPVHDFDAVSQLAQQYGISQPSQMGFISRNLQGLLGPDYMQNYVRPAAMLGGAYVGANMLGNVYNRFRGEDPNQPRRRQVVIV